MAVARRPQAFAVVVHRHAAEDDLLLPVTVYVGDAQVVIALAGELRVPIRVRGEDPTLHDLALTQIPGCQHAPSVVAARHDQSRPLAVEVGDTSQESIDAIAIVVATITDFAARRYVVPRGDRCEGPPVEPR